MSSLTFPDPYWPVEEKVPVQSIDSPSSEVTSSVDIREVQESALGQDKLIPLAYGRMRVGALTSIVTLDASGNLVILAVWCIGEIGGIVEITSNDEPLPAGATVTNYVGSTGQPVDPTIEAIIPGYTNRLVYDTRAGSVGIAYSVVVIPPDEDVDFPDLSAVVDGRKVYNPKTMTREFSANPALALSDILSDPVIGGGKTPDYTQLEIAQDACDELVGGKPRRAFGIALNRTQSVARAGEVLRGYAGAMIEYQGDKFRIIPNRPTNTSASVGQSEIIKDTLQLVTSSISNQPTVVSISYTDTSEVPWRSAKAYYVSDRATSGSDPWLEKTVSKTGIQDYAQAYREAKETYLDLVTNRFRYQWRATDEAYAYRVGEVFALNHEMGLDNKLVRITSIDLAEAGRWIVKAADYSPDIYSDDAPSPPASGGTVGSPPAPVAETVEPGLDPDSPDSPIQTNITGLNAASIFQTLEDGSPYTVFHVTWDHIAPDPNFRYYRVEWRKRGSGNPWATATPAENEYTTGLVEEGEIYDIRVRAEALNDALGPWALVSELAQGKVSSDTVVTSFVATPAPFSVELLWAYPAGVGDIRTADLYFHTINDYSEASKLTSVDYPGIRYTHSGLLSGQEFYYWLVLTDTSGNSSDPTPWPGGLYGHASINANDILDYLTESIADSHLVQSLQEEIAAGANNTQAIIEVEEQVNGLEGQYTVKIDSAGNVAGFGLAVYPPERDQLTTSEFVVLADRFAIIDPSQPAGESVVPFVVQNGQTYIKEAFIGDAYIKNANIDQLAVGTSKIDFNSATNLQVGSAGAYGLSYNYGRYLSTTTLYNVNQVYAVSGVACGMFRATLPYRSYDVDYTFIFMLKLWVISSVGDHSVEYHIPYAHHQPGGANAQTIGVPFSFVVNRPYDDEAESPVSYRMDCYAAVDSPWASSTSPRVTNNEGTLLIGRR